MARRAYVVASIILLCGSAYHLKVCPQKAPAPILLFPAITLEKGMTLTMESLLEGDMVLILKRDMGVVVNRGTHFCKVSYISSVDGTFKTGIFPYTIVEKINVR